MEQVFGTREQLLASIQEHALSHGYAITTIRSNRDRNISLGCDRGDVYYNYINALDRAKQRKTSTRLLRGRPSETRGGQRQPTKPSETGTTCTSHMQPIRSITHVLPRSKIT
jgi:hypothetical protein